MDSRDWKKCFLCQTDTKEVVNDPSLSKKLKLNPDKLKTSLQNIITNICDLKKFGALPDFCKISDIISEGVLDEKGIEITVDLLISNKALFHHSCLSSIIG